MQKTDISWADYVWNFVTGCVPVSPGCLNCYAKAIAESHWGPRKFTDVLFNAKKLEEVRLFPSGAKVFVNSMSDLFQKAVTNDQLERAFAAMKTRPDVHFLILTKRVVRMDEWVDRLFPVPENIWWGYSAEDQRFYGARSSSFGPEKSFISLEPLIGPVVIDPKRHAWVIAGCESAIGRRPGERPAQDAWFRSIRDQCAGTGVPFFLKQMVQDGRLVEEPFLDGVQHLAFPDAFKPRPQPQVSIL